MPEGRERPLNVDSVPAKDLDFEALARDLRPLSYAKRLELLHFLVRPHYLEEIASHLKMARQAAQKHIDQLLDIGVIKKQLATGPAGQWSSTWSCRSASSR